MKIEIYLDKAEEWRWRFIRRGHIMADGGQGYKRKVFCQRAIERIQNTFADAEVVDLTKVVPAEPKKAAKPKAKKKPIKVTKPKAKKKPGRLKKKAA